MASKKRKSPSASVPTTNPNDAIGSILSTFAGPSTSVMTQQHADGLSLPAQRRLATQRLGAGLAAAAMPFNPVKAAEHGIDHGHAPTAGTPTPPHHIVDTASSVTEGTPSAKLGGESPPQGINSGNGPLDTARVDSSSDDSER